MFVAELVSRASCLCLSSECGSYDGRLFRTWDPKKMRKRLSPRQLHPFRRLYHRSTIFVALFAHTEADELVFSARFGWPFGL